MRVYPRARLRRGENRSRSKWPEWRRGGGARALLSLPPMRLASALSTSIVVLAIAAPAAAMTSSDGAHRVTVHLDSPLGGPLAGFGGQMNANLDDPVSRRAAGISDHDERVIRADMARLAPQSVRVFYDKEMLHDCDRLRSFVDTIDIAQNDGATVNVTYWKGYGYPHPGLAMRSFADVITTLVTGEPRSPEMVACKIPLRPRRAVRYVTIQNEPNNNEKNQVNILGARPLLYATLYRDFDADLRADGDRKKVDLVGGDLVRTNERAWLRYMAQHLAGVLDGYSIHVYWDHRDFAYGVNRLETTRSWVDALPPRARLPLYVTEFGVRGEGVGGRIGAPGRVNGAPSERSPSVAFQEGLFDLMAARLGYRAAVKWDLYPSIYDLPSRFDGACAPEVPSQIAALAHLVHAGAHQLMGWSLIRPPSAGLRRNPGFGLMRLMTHMVPRGAHAVEVSGGGSGHVVAAFKRGQETSVVLANQSATAWATRVAGLPANHGYVLGEWTARGLKEEAPKRTGPAGVLTVNVPPGGFVAVRLSEPGLGL